MANIVIASIELIPRLSKHGLGAWVRRQKNCFMFFTLFFALNIPTYSLLSG